MSVRASVHDIMLNSTLEEFFRVLKVLKRGLASWRDHVTRKSCPEPLFIIIDLWHAMALSRRSSPDLRVGGLTITTWPWPSY